jgi:hypothetical protein
MRRLHRAGELSRQACRLEIRLREAPIADDPGRRYVETYCYAFAAGDFLKNEWQQLYWRTAIVQMTRYYMRWFHASSYQNASRMAPGMLDAWCQQFCYGRPRSPLSCLAPATLRRLAFIIAFLREENLRAQDS